MPVSINRVAAMLLIAFLLLAGMLGYWVAGGAALAARQDNPRRILAEQRILRGRILDRRGTTIVETVGEPGAYERAALYRYAAPFTGYYSINYGTSEVERSFDSTLRGRLGLDAAQVYMNDLLHISPAGRAVQLTIDLGIQRAADTLLDGHTGAIVVTSVPDADILALASRPTFDPNGLDENWDTLRDDSAAPLLNRATLGQYQPGTALQPILMVEALRRGIASLEDTPETPARPFPVDSRALTCRSPNGVITLADAFAQACPAPAADLGVMLGGDALSDIVATWRLTDTTVVGLQSRPVVTTSIVLTGTRALQEFAVGQGQLTFAPLHMAGAATTLAARGLMTPARIVSATETIDGGWRPIERPLATRIAPREVVERVVAAMPHTGDIAWYGGIGLSGAKRLMWFVGFAPIENTRYATVVLIESDADVEAVRSAIEIGQQLLRVLLSIAI